MGKSYCCLRINSYWMKKKKEKRPVCVTTPFFFVLLSSIQPNSCSMNMFQVWFVDMRDVSINGHLSVIYVYIYIHMYVTYRSTNDIYEVAKESMYCVEMNS